MPRPYSQRRTAGYCTGLTAGLLLLAYGAFANAGDTVRHEFIELALHPRVCTMSAQDEECSAVVQAQWRSSRDESLCLVIVGQPQIKRCWEHYAAGVYKVELSFSEDLVVELRDPQLQRVLAAEAITVIKEALRLRHKRRQPWNIL
jgi:hypothetical protein